MQPQARPSHARRIALTVIAVCLGLILIGALLPNPAQRRAAIKAHRIASLVRAKPPVLSSDPAFVRHWNIGYRPTPDARRTNVHAYLKLGVRTSRADLLSNSQPSFGDLGSGTILHIAFDPKKPDELRLVTALAARPDATGLLYATFLRGARTTGSLAGLRSTERSVGAAGLALARHAVLAELNDGSATAYPAGTVLYETEGRFYLEPKFVGAGTALPYTGSPTTAYEALEAMSDRNVPLP